MDRTRSALALAPPFRDASDERSVRFGGRRERRTTERTSERDARGDDDDGAAARASSTSAMNSSERLKRTAMCSSVSPWYPAISSLPFPRWFA
jgi:hypothetical protein